MNIFDGLYNITTKNFENIIPFLSLHLVSNKNNRLFFLPKFICVKNQDDIEADTDLLADLTLRDLRSLPSPCDSCRNPAESGGI